MNALAARPGRRVQRDGGLLSRDAALALTAALLLPLALHGAGLPQLNRILYPLVAFAAAIFLYARKSPWYPGLCIWLFAASPLIRRMADERLGFQLSSSIILAPYLACAVAGLSLFPYLTRSRPVLAWPFATILCCIFYGFLMAVLSERVASGVVDLLKWSIGPLMAVHLMQHADQREAMHQVVLRAYIVAGMAMSAYGVAQFISPASWDAEWLRNMILQGMTSSGRPEPYQVRVFSTMHSAGSFGAFLSVSIVMLLAAPAVVALPGLALMGAGLALCQYRAVWTATAVSVLLVLLAAPGRVRFRVVLGVAAVAMGLAAAATIPEVEQVLSDRVRTITELKSDSSGEERLSQYTRLLGDGESLVFGSGLAINGAARQLDKQNAALIDSGLLEVLLALGLPLASVFLWCLVYLSWRTGTVPKRTCTQVHLYRGVAVGWLLQLPFGTIFIGEIGFGPWLCVGLAMASLAARAQAEPAGRSSFGAAIPAPIGPALHGPRRRGP